METIKYLIVDDEPLAHQSLGVLLKNYDQLQCIGNCYNAFKALSFIKENKPDLLFLDMDMPDMNGMELLKAINKPINVIITTAHSDYAVQGYEFGVIDFLVKPIKAERLFKAMTKVFDVFSKVNTNIVEKTEKKEETQFINEKQNYVFGTLDKKIFEKIYFDDILFIEKQGNYLYIHATNGKAYYYLTSLKTIMSILPKEEFTFANQSVIISKSKVDCPDGQNVVVKDNLVFKVSPNFQDKIKKRNNKRE
jgi:DNA-binding LytR/AlgR family response regulator